MGPRPHSHNLSILSYLTPRYQTMGTPTIWVGNSPSFCIYSYQGVASSRVLAFLSLYPYIHGLNPLFVNLFPSFHSHSLQGIVPKGTHPFIRNRPKYLQYTLPFRTHGKSTTEVAPIIPPQTNFKTNQPNSTNPTLTHLKIKLTPERAYSENSPYLLYHSTPWIRPI